MLDERRLSAETPSDIAGLRDGLYGEGDIDPVGWGLSAARHYVVDEQFERIAAAIRRKMPQRIEG